MDETINSFCNFKLKYLLRDERVIDERIVTTNYSSINAESSKTY